MAPLSRRRLLDATHRADFPQGHLLCVTYPPIVVLATEPALVVRILVRNDRARAAVEAEAQVRELGADRVLVVVWEEELAEARVRGERDGAGDCPWCSREVEVAPLADVHDVNYNADGADGEEEGGEGVCGENTSKEWR